MSSRADSKTGLAAVAEAAKIGGIADQQHAHAGVGGEGQAGLDQIGAEAGLAVGGGDGDRAEEQGRLAADGDRPQPDGAEQVRAVPRHEAGGDHGPLAQALGGLGEPARTEGGQHQRVDVCGVGGRLHMDVRDRGRNGRG